MKIDLRKCKAGDKLISCHGEVLTYIRHEPEAYFPHIVEYADGSLGSRTDEGFVSSCRPLETDHNIVEIVSCKLEYIASYISQIVSRLEDVTEQEIIDALIGTAWDEEDASELKEYLK